MATFRRFFRYVAVAVAVLLVSGFGMLLPVGIVITSYSIHYTKLYEVYLLWQGGGQALSADATTLGLLALAGPATVVPLALFAFGARRLKP